MIPDLCLLSYFKSLLRQGLSEPEFYGDLVYKLKKIVGSYIFSVQFIKIISHYKKIGYNINVLQQTACLVVNTITILNFAILLDCTTAGQTLDYMTIPTLRLIGPDVVSVDGLTGDLTVVFPLLRYSYR